ncbi:MAG: MarR family winged helix-turn-helix transcriptional regulator, partial [Acidobacteriota bacterium]
GGHSFLYSCFVQPDTGTRSPSRLPPTTLPSHDPSLADDADGFSRALEALARVYQLQDPRQTCSYGISLTECYSLEAVVHRGPLTVNEVAAALSFDKSTASRAVASLRRKGLVVRRGHPRDGRAVEVSAAASGMRLYRRIRESARACHRELLEEFPPEVRRGATVLLQRIASTERACASTGGARSSRA